jgi:hypothetical protein
MTDERRAHPRIEVYAQVEIPHEGAIELLVAHDLSEGGVFLPLAPGECSWLTAGMTFDLVLAPAGDESAPAEENVPVATRGRVVRRSDGGDWEIAGIGVAFVELDELARSRLRHLLERARRR